jgi:hypothetical protein
MTGLVDPDSKPRRWPHGRFRAAKPLRMYLRPGDNFGMVMPNAVPSRRQYHGFRAGRFAVEGQPFPIEFGTRGTSSASARSSSHSHRVSCSQPALTKAPACSDQKVLDGQAAGSQRVLAGGR